MMLRYPERSGLVIFLFVLVSTIGTSAIGDDFDVYILTGQSNSLGTTNLEVDFAPGVDPADLSTSFFWSNAKASNTTYPADLYGDSGGSITTLQMQQGDGGTNTFFWGPEFGFARQMSDNSGGNNVLIIKASRGGGGNGFWDKDTFDANNNSGHMWGHVRDTVNAGLNSLGPGDTFQVKGLIYMQGESNNSSQAGIADTRLNGLATNLKDHINTNWSGAADEMYTVVAEIAASTSGSSRIQTTEKQRGLARENGQFGFVTTRDQPLKSDGIHFGRAAKLTYGSRIADAFNSISFTEQASYIAGYYANPSSTSPVPDPAGQGMTFVGGAAGVVSEAVTDSGTRAWRILDGSATSNPGYRQDLVVSDFEKMFNNGWQFKTTAKVVSSGGLALWSVTQGNDPGWGLTDARNMNGFQLSRINGDELRVTVWNAQQSFDLGAGSADVFHTLEMRGDAMASTYDFFVDGVLMAANLDLRDGVGLGGFDDILTFNSGSSSGVGLEVYWNQVSLMSIPEPSTASLLTIFLSGLAWRRRR